MKNNIKNILKLLICLTGFAILLFSCNYQEIADADYPSSKLYMPSAVHGIYLINSVPQDLDFHPTPGHTSRFYIDASYNKFIVPLGVYRSGINRAGKLIVAISANTDTVSAMINSSLISETTILIPEGKFTIPSSVEIPDGGEYETFNLEIDLDYLEGLSEATVGLGIIISSNDCEVNPLLDTTVILIDVSILN